MNKVFGRVAQRQPLPSTIKNQAFSVCQTSLELKLADSAMVRWDLIEHFGHIHSLHTFIKYFLDLLSLVLL